MAKSHGEGLKYKIKSLLGIRKPNTIQKTGIENEEEHGFIFSPDVLKEICKENNFGHRARVLKELSEVVSTRKLEEHAAEAVWSEISDMLQPSVPTEARQTALKFLVSLITGQFQWLGMLRAQFLRLIENHDVNEDLNCRIELLRALTDNGKDVTYCEHFGPFLLRFSRQALTGDRTVEYLHFLVNLVHYNSSFLEKDIITGLVEQACAFCNKAQNEKEIECCILLLDATVRYGGLPSDGLYPLIATLCRTVNIEKFCQASWKLMKTLVGTRLGHSAIYIMCCILEDENNADDSILLRGAVFFIGMCVWGSKRVSSLQHKPISLLPSFKQALHCNHPIVAHEIGLSLQRLVKKYGKDLQIVTWDIILDLIDMLIKVLQNLANSNDSLKRTVQDLLTTIEELYNAGRFDGSADRFFKIIERYSAQRPESSVLTFLTFLHKQIDPAHDAWLDKLKFVMEKYFRNSTQTAVRVKVLDILSDVMNSYRYWYEEEILDLVVLHYLSGMELEKDPSVRLVTAQFMVDLVGSCSSNKSGDILLVVKKLINRLMDSSGSNKKINGEQLISDGEHLRDIKVAVCGLVEVFKQKLLDSSTTIAVKILEILVEHVFLHYVNGFTAHSGAIVRLEILKLFLSIRADEGHRVGVLDLDTADQKREIKFSVFATCKQMRGKEVANPLGRKLSLTKYCPTNKAFDAILNCLKDEWEWTVLQFVLQNLPAQLRNKTLILGGGADVSNLCAFLCYMVNDGQFLNKVKNVPPGSGRVELHNLVFPILAVLVTYQNSIERQRQLELVKSLELGINSQCARLCVVCLTICILEMKSVMLRTLPSILIKLSKVSATVMMSIPMLEFLSSLKEVKELYSNFVEEQYMSIFAIALPYTDAFRYSAYTVTLAHYVISSWFTRCRLAFRKGFVRLITKGLQSSAIIRPIFLQPNEKQAGSGKQSGPSEDIRVFHEDMKEVCSDMMAKYSFSTLSNQPKRSSVVEFLLANGVSQSWLVGNTLVTVTTSCSSAEACVACNQRRVMVTASKAASKLRPGKNDEEVRLGRDHKSPARSLAVESSATRVTELSSGALKEDPSSSKDHSKKGHSRPELVLPVEKAESSKALVTSIEVKPGAENGTSHREARVDSAVEMTEEAESVKESTLMTALLSSDVKPEISDAKPTQSPLEVTPNVIADSEISLVNRLALQEQNLNTGYVFSPTNYFLSEMGSLAEPGISATSSMEFPKDQGESKTVDTDDGDYEEDVKTLGCSTIAAELTAVDGAPKAEHLDTKSADSESAVSMNDRRTQEISKDGEQLPIEAKPDDEARSTETEAVPKGKPDVTMDVTDVVPPRISPRLEQDVLTCGDNELPKKQPLLSTKPISTNVSQNSSLQGSPLASNKTLTRDSIELSSEFEMVEEADASSFTSREAGNARSLADTICNCSSEGWAEVMIRRPTGNTSWVTKIENALGESDVGRIEDIATLAAAVEAEDYITDIRQFYKSPQEDMVSTRPRFMSAITDELSKERQTTRSSSDSPKPFAPEVSCDSPSTFRRRRFSTGSIDIPATFRLSSPSPDVSKEKDGIADASFASKYHFEKPSLGLSPHSPFKRYGSTSSLSDLKGKTSDSLKDLISSESYRGDWDKSIYQPKAAAVGHTNLSEKQSKSSTGTKHTLSKTLSGPATTSYVSQSAISSTLQVISLTKERGTGKPPATHDRENRETSKATLQEAKLNAGIAGSLRKDTDVVVDAQERYVSRESQRDLAKKGPSKLEPQKQLKEPLKAGAQALKDRISSFSTYRPRVNTISAYPVSKQLDTGVDNKERLTLPDKDVWASLNPYFLFLQFFYSPFVNAGGSARPLLLGGGEVVGRAVKMLDRIPPYDHHKIGVLYVGPDQESDETAILANQFGSHRYAQFLRGLGKLTSLMDCSYTEVYTGGLDRNGADGKFAYSWRDDITQVIFHVATLMPSKKSDPACYSKKLHIGNNFVTIVYNDSKKPYQFGTIKGQFNFAEVEIKPLDYNCNLVTVRMKDDLKDVSTNTGPHVISDENLPVLSRQLAIHTNMATVLHRNKNKPSDAYGCNWLERLRQIKRIRSKAAAENQGLMSASNVGSTKNSSAENIAASNPDFTDYT